VSLRYYTEASQIFAGVVRQHAGRRALVWTPSDSTSYDELDRVSNQIGRLLLDRGVRKRDTVCINLEKSQAAYAAILACLKIGAAYFVVDIANPKARTRMMLDRCRPAVAFVSTASHQAAFACPTIRLDPAHRAALPEGVSDGPIDRDWPIDGSDPAYIMFTSGSTGTPKGVTISHSNLVNFIAWSQDEFQTRPDDVFTNLNPLFFDNSVFDIYSSLFAGAALAPFSAAILRDPNAIVSRIEELACTVYFSVPSLLVYLQTMKLISRSTFQSLKKIIFGGEGYPKPMLARLFETVGDRIALYNVYGPTECTCICSVYRIGAADFSQPGGFAPLGRLIRNFSYVIVDQTGRPARPGDVGELCLGGPCVGLGYYGEAALTASSFIQNPAHDRFFDRVYRTGDLVRCDPDDGKLHFIGRADSQIKHQGYRIELGEVEHALTAIEGVEEAAALYLSNGTTGRIVGVVAARPDLTPAGIKEALALALPRFMVPDRVVIVGRLPKNANGKIDRKAMAESLAGAEAL
jgi:D-alanine--poly(phosphoribitol) ligase subunit 1